jgi:gamma-glutamyltranspeptidase/glutathione hydrolase
MRAAPTVLSIPDYTDKLRLSPACPVKNRPEMTPVTRSLVLVLAISGVAGDVPVGAASGEPVRARSAMVGSTEEHASRAGLEILRSGGNAIDAAVAVGFALAVTHPAAGNLGGGGFMVLRLADGRETTIDYRERAPAAAHRDMYLDERGTPVAERSLVGALAAGVPGSVAGMTYAQGKYGRLPLARVMAPAVALARDGFEVSWALADSLSADGRLLDRFPASARAFRRSDGTPLRAGDRLAQADLARTLSLIAEHGPDAFYRGPIADLVAAEMARSGGLITKADLAAYEPRERPPVVGEYRGHRIVSMAPPSSGGIALIQLLNILEAFPLGGYGHNSSRTIHLVAEAARRVYADRSEWLGDPDHFAVPTAGLLSRRYAEHLRMGISEVRATPSHQVRPGQPREFESSETTHFSVVDADGNAVSTTTTLNGSYGNGQLVPGAGFLLNNEMDDFSVKPGTPNMFGLIGGQANAVAAGKRMLSSMTPTIVVKDGRTRLVLGSPGGSRIITTVLQVVLNVIDFGMTVQEAVDAPRFHHQWLPDAIRLERRGFPADVTMALEAMGHSLTEGANMGDVHAIMIDGTGLRLGASDPRLDGRTVGY